MRKFPTILYVILSSLMMVSSCSSPIRELETELDKLVNEFPGEVGIAMIYGCDTAYINADNHFPMFSIVKFPQALGVCEMMRTVRGLSSFDSDTPCITVTPVDMRPGTWSPMREKHPNGGVFSIPDLLEYTLIESDNNACDLIFGNIVSTSQLDSIIHSWGINDCNIVWTEEEQHCDISRCYDNWASPSACVQLLHLLFEAKETDELSSFVWDTMAKCSTGENRIPKYITNNVSSIVHKTGTGAVSPDGVLMGIGDVACIEMKNGKLLFLSVLIKDASCGSVDCEELIARIAKLCIQAYYK